MGKDVSIYVFSKSKTKPFEEIIVGVITKEISRYSIYPVRMLLFSKTGESIVKIKKWLLKLKYMIGVSPGNREDLLFGETAIPDGLKISAMDFIPVIFDAVFNYFYNASFALNVYSKTYGMIMSLDSSVRCITSGVQLVDIDRHEITFKSPY